MAAETKCIREIHEQAVDGAARVHCEARLLFCPEEPRWVTVTDYKTKETMKVPTASILIADNTGPIILELWRQMCESTLPSLLEWDEQNAGIVWIVAQNVQPTAWKGVCKPAMKRLRTTEDTSIFLMEAPPLVQFKCPSSSLHVNDFNALRTALPFCINLIGTIAEVKAEEDTQSGRTLRRFSMQDDAGRYVRCVALGRHVDNPVLRARNEVILYFAKAQPGLNQSAGQLWLYDDAHMVMTRPNRFLAPPDTEVELLAK